MAKKKVFLVDDNTTCLMLGKQVLKDDFETFTMPSSAKMFELLKKIKPDIILLDIEMPEISGYEAFEQLKAAGAGAIPVVFVTGNEEGGAAEKSKALGAAGYVTKPFSPESLREIINAIVA
ncbi:MAG: response regulator [Spirochaetaceae bacterium]|jgi:putative two-component system response regulator|nr:response regulator [Spirochaetaceae bacterium]